MKRFLIPIPIVLLLAGFQAPKADDAGKNKQLHCPTAVSGARVKARNTKEGVELTVTAKGDAVAEIQKRTEHLVSAARKEGSGRHTGEGDYGGQVGKCPVVMHDTEVTAQPIKNGAVITIKALKAEAAAALQKQVKERLAKP